MIKTGWSWLSVLLPPPSLSVFFSLSENQMSGSYGPVSGEAINTNFIVFGLVRSELEGPPWPWSYGSWIYNYICNQCLSPLRCCEFESRSGRSVQHYVIKFVSDLRQFCGFLWVLRFPPSIKLTATIYSWNIVESGVKYHQTNELPHSRRSR